MTEPKEYTVQEIQEELGLDWGAGEAIRKLLRTRKISGALQRGNRWYLNEQAYQSVRRRYEQGEFDEYRYSL